MAFAEGVLLEAVFIAHLALADLAEPSEALQAFLQQEVSLMEGKLDKGSTHQLQLLAGKFCSSRLRARHFDCGIL
jgi:hypothetical protein